MFSKFLCIRTQQSNYFLTPLFKLLISSQRTTSKKKKDKFIYFNSYSLDYKKIDYVFNISKKINRDINIKS